MHVCVCACSNQRKKTIIKNLKIFKTQDLHEPNHDILNELYMCRIQQIEISEMGNGNVKTNNTSW